MLTQEQGTIIVEGITVFDSLVTTQIVEKLLASGNVSGRELVAVANLRHKFHNAIMKATGVDIDQPVSPSPVENKGE